MPGRHHQSKAELKPCRLRHGSGQAEASQRFNRDNAQALMPGPFLFLALLRLQAQASLKQDEGQVPTPVSGGSRHFGATVSAPFRRRPFWATGLYSACSIWRHPFRRRPFRRPIYVVEQVITRTTPRQWPCESRHICRDTGFCAIFFTNA